VTAMNGPGNSFDGGRKASVCASCGRPLVDYLDLNSALCKGCINKRLPTGPSELSQTLEQVAMGVIAQYKREGMELFLKDDVVHWRAVTPGKTPSEALKRKASDSFATIRQILARQEAPKEEGMRYMTAEQVKRYVALWMRWISQQSMSQPVHHKTLRTLPPPCQKD